MRYQLILLLIFTAGTFPAWPQASAGQELQAHQRVLDQARRDFDYRSSQLPAGERADYEAYIATLEVRLAEACASALRQAVTIPVGVDCTEAAPAAATPTTDPGTARTRTEVTGALDEQLDAGLGEFDELLLREQARVKADAPSTAGGQGSAGGGQAGQAGGQAGAGSESVSSTVTATDASQVPSGAAGGQQQAVVAPVPDDIPDGSDDDVVARQLRAAAEQETDPQLREKLWDEYRKYKQGTGAQ